MVAKDVVLIGAGPASLYCAFSLKKQNPKLSVLVIEKGTYLKDRKCPAKENNTRCMKCKVCAIASGLAGAGAYSDGKFPITNDFGGSLWEKIGKEKALEYQRQVDSHNETFYKNSSYYAETKKDFPKLYSSKNSVYKKICTQHNLHLMDADIRHLGTDLSQIIFEELYKTCKKLGVEFLVNTEVEKVYKGSVDNYIVKTYPDRMYVAKYVVVATGRAGSNWVKEICENLEIPTSSNKVDIGIRFECLDEIWNHITKDLYESKIVYRTETYEDLVRTFCMNPSGTVVTENTIGGITVNGHSYEDDNLKTNNTNFALLVSKTFTEPFNNSSEYGKAIVELSNMLSGGVMVQRYGDLIRGKRSTQTRISENTVRPTLNAEPGDLSLVLPKRILDDILEMIKKLDHFVPGMTNDDNLLYGVELKAYDNIVETNNTFENENYLNLFFIGDSSGVSHSLSQSSAMGLCTADIISNREPKDRDYKKEIAEEVYRAVIEGVNRMS